MRCYRCRAVWRLDRPGAWRRSARPSRRSRSLPSLRRRGSASPIGRRPMRLRRRPRAAGAPRSVRTTRRARTSLDFGIVSIGAAIHALLTAKAALKRLIRRPAKARGAGRSPATAPSAAEVRPAWVGLQADDGGLTSPAAYAPRPKGVTTAPAPATPESPGPRVAAPVGPLKPGARAVSDAQLKFAFSPRGEWTMPPLAVLAEPKKSAREDFQRRARAERPHAGGRARRFRRQGRDHERPPRPGRDPLRTRAGAGRKILARHRPRRRYRPLDVRGLGARRGRAGPQRHRHRAAEPAPRNGVPSRAHRQRGLREVEASAGDRARQDDRRRAGDRRSRAHAASPGRRHHRLRQVGGDQHHDSVARLSAEAGTVPPDHGRPQDARALGLRRDPPPADAGGHRPEEGGCRPQMGGAGDGGPLQEDVQGRGAQHRRFQQPGGGGRAPRARR